MITGSLGKETEKKKRTKLRVAQGENASGHKSANKSKQWKQSVRVYPGPHVVSTCTLSRSFISAQAFQANVKKTSKGQLRDESLLSISTVFDSNAIILNSTLNSSKRNTFSPWYWKIIKN